MRCKSIVRFLFVVATATAQPQPAELAVVSAASFSRDATLAADMIATAFSAAVPDEATISVSVRDSAGVERFAGVISRSRGQISFVVPPSTAQGPATLAVIRGGAALASARATIGRVSPGIFTANASGEGPPAGFVLQALTDGSRVQSNLFEQLAGGARYEPRPFDLGSNQAETYLVLFGTGVRGARIAEAAATLDGVAVPIQAMEAQGEFDGLDQVNIGPLPRELAGRRGTVELLLTVAGTRANPIAIAPTFPPSGGWSRRTDLLEANSEMSVVSLDGKIYVLGGYPASRVTVPTVQVYDTSTNTWALTTPLPVAVNHAMPAAWNGKLYLIGGQTGATTRSTCTLGQDYPTDCRTCRGVRPYCTPCAADADCTGMTNTAGTGPSTCNVSTNICN